jgi:hypothetical protein
MPIFLLAYIGPETVLPVGSVLAALGGMTLMFWNYLRSAAVWCLGRLRGSDSRKRVGELARSTGVGDGA